MGISRVYLFQPPRAITLIFYIYATALVTFVLYEKFVSETGKISYDFVRNTVVIEYICLVFAALFVKKKKTMDFFNKLGTYDELLNITNYVTHTDPVSRGLLWLTGNVFFYFCENLILMIQFKDRYDLKLMLYYYIVAFSHDIEALFFFSTIRSIYIRLRIIKAHVWKLSSMSQTNEDRNESKNIENISKKAELDVSSLHRAYELLHYCAKTLNSTMRYPVSSVVSIKLFVFFNKIVIFL